MILLKEVVEMTASVPLDVQEQTFFTDRRTLCPADYVCIDHRPDVRSERGRYSALSVGFFSGPP